MTMTPSSILIRREAGSRWFESYVLGLGESAFAPYVDFCVLMTSKLETNVILMRYVAAISPMKDSKSW